MSRARDFADLAGSSSNISTVAADSSTLDQVATSYGAGGITGKNLIINGAMQVWQRSTSPVTAVSGGYAGVDRWRFGFTNTYSMEQGVLTSSDTPFASGFRFYHRMKNTSAVSATNTIVQMLQRIEAQDIASSGWDYTSSSSYITLSFWVRCSLAGTYFINMRTSDGTSYQYSSSFTLSANTWTKVIKTVPGNSNLQFDNNADTGLNLNIAAHYGTDYTDSSATSDVWRIYPNNTTLTQDFGQDFKNTLNATFDVTGVQLEVGSQATPFEHRSYGDELSRCQRYYVDEIYASAGGYASGSGQTARCPANFTYPVPMRAAPTITTTVESQGNVASIGATSDVYSAYVNATSSSSGSMYYRCNFELDAEL